MGVNARHQLHHHHIREYVGSKHEKGDLINTTIPIARLVSQIGNIITCTYIIQPFLGKSEIKKTTLVVK